MCVCFLSNIGNSSGAFQASAFYYNGFMGWKW